MFELLDPATSIIAIVRDWVWGLPLILLLLGTGLYLTVRLRFIQFFGFFEAMRLAFIVREEHTGEGDINHFQSLMTALSATVGTGNIVGVATAITLGGPGALFWMWLTGLLGMATKYAEAVLAVKYRIKDERGEMAGGPMYYIMHGLNMKWLGVLFAFFASVAAFGIGNLVQSNAVSGAIAELFAGVPGVSPFSIGVLLALLTGAVILGGIKEIGRVTGLLVPVMILFYLGAGIYILIIKIDLLPAALALIFRQAFTPEAGVGGVAGFTITRVIQSGVARGIFSNESGLGSAPIAAAAAKTKEPVAQALVSMTQTFIDTLVVCTITGLIIVISGAWQDPNARGLLLTRSAFNRGLPGGEFIVYIGLILFAFSTIIGWYYYGERSIYFLLGGRAILPYKILWVAAVLVGAQAKLEFVWTVSDLLNGLMALPNLIALIGLSGVISRETRGYFRRKRAIE